MALTEVGHDRVGGELAVGAVEGHGAETFDAVIGAPVLAGDWEGGGGSTGHLEGPLPPPRPWGTCWEQGAGGEVMSGTLMVLWGGSRWVGDSPVGLIAVVGIMEVT